MGARGFTLRSPSTHLCAWVNIRAGRLRLPHSFFTPLKRKAPHHKARGFLFVLVGLQLDVLGAYIQHLCESLAVERLPLCISVPFDE